MKRIETILVATDFSETAAAALDHACALAKQLGAGIVVVHAYEIPMYGLPDGALVATAEMVGKILDGANKGLADLTEMVRARGVAVRSILAQGPALEEIHKVARDVAADLIVLGTHGRRGIAHALMGSTAEKIVRTAIVPVLTVRQPTRGQ